jgi:hypothetical protein
MTQKENKKPDERKKPAPQNQNNNTTKQPNSWYGFSFPFILFR